MSKDITPIGDVSIGLIRQPIPITISSGGSMYKAQEGGCNVLGYEYTLKELEAPCRAL